MSKRLAFVFGSIFLIAAVMGFYKKFTPDGKLFGLLATNLEHNVLNLAAGILGILSSLAGRGASRKYFFTFGIIFLALAAIGFWQNEPLVLGMIASNSLGNWIRAEAGVLFLGLAFFFRKKKGGVLSHSPCSLQS